MSIKFQSKTQICEGANDIHLLHNIRRNPASLTSVFILHSQSSREKKNKNTNCIIGFLITFDDFLVSWPSHPIPSHFTFLLCVSFCIVVAHFVNIFLIFITENLFGSIVTCLNGATVANIVQNLNHLLMNSKLISNLSSCICFFVSNYYVCFASDSYRCILQTKKNTLQNHSGFSWYDLNRINISHTYSNLPNCSHVYNPTVASFILLICLQHFIEQKMDRFIWVSEKRVYLFMAKNSLSGYQCYTCKMKKMKIRIHDKHLNCFKWNKWKKSEKWKKKKTKSIIISIDGILFFR